MVDFHEELHVLLGGALSASECELIFAPDATRPLATSILQSLHEGRLSVVSEEDLRYATSPSPSFTLFL